MGSTIGEILPVAVGVAVSPMPVIAVVLMLFSKRAAVNGPAFVAGWVLGIATVGTVVLAISGPGHVSGSGGGPSTTGSTVQLVLGLLLVALAVWEFRRRPAKGREASTPRWMAGIEGFTPARSLAVGALLSGLNPKNLLLTVSAAVTIAQAGLGTGGVAVSFAVFAVIASLSVALPVVVDRVAPQRAGRLLEDLEAWLVDNNAVVMAVLLLVLGVAQVGKGIGGLTR